jgi:acetoin utilization deacetylase AcuC-like enzyme
MPLVIVTSDRFADHVTPPGHPERIERAEAMQVVADRARAAGREIIEPRRATDEDLVRVHVPEHLETIGAARGRTAMIDEDTFMSPDSDEVARLAAGAVLTAVDRVLDGPRGTRAFAMVRPPGHHAEADRAMGFCLYNSVAVGAAAARSRGVDRVAVVDFDVHHGNGTQWIFYEDPSVLFVSSHQFPFYPGTGAAAEVGRGDGAGRTVNLPLEVGATDADFDRVYGEVAVPLLGEFQPDLLLVSAGFDAHVNDPLAGMRMTGEGFGRLLTRLIGAADDLCGGRIVLVTEGGYDTAALADCCQRVIDLGSAGALDALPPATGDTRRAESTLAAVRQAQAPYWRAVR